MDTNVLSELTKPKADKNVLEGFDKVNLLIGLYVVIH